MDKPKVKCKSCGHYDICKNREAFEELVEKDVVHNIFSMVSDIHESFHVELVCDHYHFDWTVHMRNTDYTVDKLERKKILGIF